MIEGLHFDIPYADFLAHLTSKAKYHAERSIWYKEKVDDLEGSGIEKDMEAYSGGSPLSNLKKKYQEHVQRSEYFTLLADYLVDNETYRLSKSDMVDIELIQRYY